MLVVGERETREETVSLRRRTGEDLGQFSLSQILAELASEIASRSVTLTVGRSQ
jgi:threonyl-tRNA synthetase